jgi:TetR/AcrR family transcriptional regulator, cholesterol catabolism regulator
MARPKQSREARSAIKKSWILEKAQALFWQKGYHRTSIKDIANACQCKPANIYNYFESKEEILYEVIRSITRRTIDTIKPLQTDETTSPAEQLRTMLKSHFGLLAKMPKSIILINDTGLKELTPEHRKAIIRERDIYDGILRSILRRGIERGQFAPVDDQIIGYFISSVLVRSNIWFSARGRLTADQVTDVMFDFIYNGIKAGGDRAIRA